MRSEWLAYGHSNRNVRLLLGNACGARGPAAGLGNCVRLKPDAIGLDPVTMRLEPLVYAQTAVRELRRGVHHHNPNGMC